MFELAGESAEDYTLTESVGKIDGVHDVYFIFYTDSQAKISNFAFLEFSAD